jgi:hypothetical protein
MDPLPGTFYWKGVILVRAPDAPFAPFRAPPKEKPPPLRPPIEPLKSLSLSSLTSSIGTRFDAIA